MSLPAQDRRATSFATYLRFARDWKYAAMSRLPLATVTIAFVLFRLPALLNAGVINSDGAITALQARHILQGEWAWLHWGRDYLTSIDSVMAAPFFAVFGATPVIMMAVTVLGQMTSMWFLHAILRRRIDAWTASVAVLPIVWMTMALNIYLFFDIRQWCLALAVTALWLLDGASESRWPLRRYALGVATGVGATFIDLFAIQFIPALIPFAVLCGFDAPRGGGRVARRVAVVVGATGASFVLVRFLEHAAGVSTNRASWLFSRIPENFILLRDTCLPWLIGQKIFRLGPHPYPDYFALPSPYDAMQSAGAAVFGCALVSGASAAFLTRIPWKVRRLGLLGSALSFGSLAGFLVSTAATDMWGARLLAPVILGLPLALAPAGFLLRSWRLGAVLSPYLLCIAIGGWLTFGDLVDGPVPTRTARGTGEEEAQVATMLRDRGIRYAVAHYWLAYRLTFLFEERPIVVPLDSEDRYPPYRKQYDREKVVAYLFHPSQPWLSPDQYEASFAAAHTRYEKIRMFDFTIFIVSR